MAISSLLFLVFMVTGLALKVFLNEVEPWPLIALGFQVLAVVGYIVLLARIVRGQRDDYWREHRTDAKGH